MASKIHFALLFLCLILILGIGHNSLAEDGNIGLNVVENGCVGIGATPTSHFDHIGTVKLDVNNNIFIGDEDAGC
ncbi:MAG: hypothetical protein JXR80_00600 [Deltaproteobacteria bacterium]|nr:hypothetical protein [Deltaproteobacteria bacterium]